MILNFDYFHISKFSKESLQLFLTFAENIGLLREFRIIAQIFAKNIRIRCRKLPASFIAKKSKHIISREKHDTQLQTTISPEPHKLHCSEE